MEQEITSKTREQEMFALIAEHESSTMTVKEFCELYDLSPGNYYYWQKKYYAGRSGNDDGPGGFTLLDIQPDAPAPVETGPLFAEYRGIRFYQQPTALLLKELIS